MKAIQVSTKEELKTAVDAGYDEITVVGDLAKRVSKAYKIKKYSKVAIAALVAAAGGVAVTGPVGVAVAAPIAVLTGIEIAVIIAILVLGVALVLTLTQGYDLEVDTGTDQYGRRYVKVVKKKSQPAT